MIERGFGDFPCGFYSGVKRQVKGANLLEDNPLNI